MLKSNPQIKTYRIYVGYTYLQTFHPTFLQLGLNFDKFTKIEKNSLTPSSQMFLILRGGKI